MSALSLQLERGGKKKNFGKKRKHKETKTRRGFVRRFVLFK